MPGHARPKTSPRGTRRLLSLLVRVPFLPPPPLPPSLSLILLLSPCSPPSQEGLAPFRPSRLLSPRNSVRLAGVMPARSSACIRRMMYRVKWRMERRTVVVLCIHFAFQAPPPLPTPLSLSPCRSLGTTRICLWSLMQGRQRRRSRMSELLDALRPRNHDRNAYYTHIRLLSELSAALFSCARSCLTEDNASSESCALVPFKIWQYPRNLELSQNFRVNRLFFQI